jgi:hypothetical protein
MIDSLTWNRSNQGALPVYTTHAAGYDLEISWTTELGWRLQMWQLRRGNRRIQFWDKTGYTLEEAKWTAFQLLGKYIP